VEPGNESVDYSLSHQIQAGNGSERSRVKEAL